MKCPNCGGEQFAPGFVSDVGQGSKGYSRWYDGQLETGVFGGARMMGKPWSAIQGFRCANCGRLELFADTPS